MVLKLAERILQDSDTFYIKEASLKEAQELRSIFRSVFSEDWSPMIGRKFILVAVEKQSNKVIGGIQRVVDIDSASAKGDALAVLPEFRNKGVGSSLLKVMDAELKKMGVREVNTVPGDEDAWDFFRKRGYNYETSVREGLRLQNKDENEYLPSFRLVKRL